MKTATSVAVVRKLPGGSLDKGPRLARLRARVLLASCVALANAALVGQHTAAPAMLSVAGRANANVSLASHRDVVVAVWSASENTGSTDIYAAVSRDRGKTFTSPVRVNSTPGEARVNGEQPPRVALTPSSSAVPQMTVVWTARGTAGTRILFSRSDDGGRTFSPSAVVPAGEAPGNRGWHNVAVDSNGRVHVVWLDHREAAQPATEGDAAGHNHAGHDASATSKTDGVATAQRSKLYVATIDDPASPRMLLGGVCYCCKTALAAGNDGSIYASWRHVYSGNMRDMAFAVSRNGGSSFMPAIRVSEDKWQIEGCPEDGPALAVDSRNQIHILWPTIVNDGPDGQPSIGIFYARSSDGRVFTARQRLTTQGVPHHPQIAIAGQSLIVAWDELKDGVRHVVAGRRPLDGSPETAFTRFVVGADAPGIYPALTTTASGAVVAWAVNVPDKKVVRVAAVP